MRTCRTWAPWAEVDSEAHGINASGSVVGKAQTATGDWHAFLKTIDDQNIQDLDVLWRNQPMSFNSANAINKDASVAGDLLLPPLPGLSMPP